MLNMLNHGAFQDRPLLVRCSSGQHCLQVIIRWKEVVIISSSACSATTGI